MHTTTVILAALNLSIHIGQAIQRAIFILGALSALTVPTVFESESLYWINTVVVKNQAYSSKRRTNMAAPAAPTLSLGRAIATHLEIDEKRAEFESNCKAVRDGLVDTKANAQETIINFLQESQSNALALPDGRFLKLTTKASARALTHERIYTAVDKVTPAQMTAEIQRRKDPGTLQDVFLACVVENLTVECYKYNVFPSIVKRLAASDQGPDKTAPRRAPESIVRQVAIFENRVSGLKAIAAHMKEGKTVCEMSKKEVEPVIHDYLRAEKMSTVTVVEPVARDVIDLPTVTADSTVTSTTAADSSTTEPAEPPDDIVPCLPPIPTISKYTDTATAAEPEPKRVKMENVPQLPSVLRSLLTSEHTISSSSSKSKAKTKKPTFPQFRERMTVVWDKVPVTKTVTEKSIDRICTQKVKTQISEALADLLTEMTDEN